VSAASTIPAWAIPGAKCAWIGWKQGPIPCQCPGLEKGVKLTVKRAYIRDIHPFPLLHIRLACLSFNELNTDHDYVAACFSPVTDTPAEEDVEQFAHHLTKAPEKV
jgi:hypothetical protein